MDIPRSLLEACEDFDSLGQWDRAELGRSLRQLGLSYGEVMELIPVPKGTLAGWCRTIRLTEDQVKEIRIRRGPRSGPRDTQWKRRREVESIQKSAGAEAQRLMIDPLWMAGTVLYWAEGSKTGRVLSVTNSDPRALRLFMVWVKHYLVPNPSFVLSLNLHSNNDERAAREFWRRALRMESADFYKTFLKPEGTGHRKNHLLHGVCRARLRRSADAYIRTMAWIDVVAEHCGEPRKAQRLTSLPGR